MNARCLVIALILTSFALSSCDKAQPSDVPLLSAPYEYEARADEFSGTTILIAERSEIRPGALLKTAFLCPAQPSESSDANGKDAYFTISLQTADGQSIVPTNLSFKVQDQPPFEAAWDNDFDPSRESFIVPYAQLLVGGASEAKRYSAAWSTGMTPHLKNPFRFILTEPEGPLDFVEIGKSGEMGLGRVATTAQRIMIRYDTTGGEIQDVDINLNDPAIREVLSKCGWHLDASDTGSNSDGSIDGEQRVTPMELRPHGTEILLFTNTSRSCHNDGDLQACSGALDELRRLSDKGICPVGEPGRQVWGRCLTNER